MTPIETVREALKPCPNPWCSSHKSTIADVGPYVAKSRVSDEWRGNCASCPIVTPWFDTEAEAIAAWNARPDHAAAVKELVDALETFVRSADAGEIKSRRTHAAFKALIAKRRPDALDKWAEGLIDE